MSATSSSNASSSLSAIFLRRRGCRKGCTTGLGVVALIAVVQGLSYFLLSRGYVPLPSELLVPQGHHPSLLEAGKADLEAHLAKTVGGTKVETRVKRDDSKAESAKPVAEVTSQAKNTDGKKSVTTAAKPSDVAQKVVAATTASAAGPPAAGGRRKIKKIAPPEEKPAELPHPECKEKKQYVFLHWDPHWGQHHIPSGHKTLRDCPQNCLEWVQTSDRSYYKKADIIAVHDWSGSPPLPPKAHPNQLFMFITMESPYSPFGAQHNMHLFQLQYTYRLESDVRATYIPIGLASYNEIIGPPPFTFAEKHKEAVSSLVSNCGGFVPRVSFMEDLSKHVELHSYGACFHNRDLPSHHDIKPLGKYKVAMVFENSLCHDYVTEKFYRAITQATIPLVTSYKGIPDYRKFGPTLHSYINIADYPDTAAVAREIKKIGNDEDVYDYYLEHRYMKRLDLNPLYLQNFANSTCDDFCRISVNKLQVPAEMEKLRKREIPKDTSCIGSGILKG